MKHLITIFIHWGPYSVPAFSKVGEYSEWYWMNLVNPGREKQGGYKETTEFHKNMYGENNFTQQFIYMSIDIVSRGGNFLLDIGPTADGQIPVIMQERLLEMGKWMDVNGEAIYGTTCWDETCQWTLGNIEEPVRVRYKTNYDVVKLTVAPDDGKDVQLKWGSKIEMLGYNKSIKWKQKDKNVEIEVPALTASEVPCEFAWTFKLEGVK